MVQVRNRSESVKHLYLRDILAARSRLHDHGALLILNSYPLMAAESILPEGYHVPEDGDLAQYRTIIGPRWLVGKSIHSVDAAIRSADQGADYLVAGTIFRSLSHPLIRPQGLRFLERVCRAVSIPVIAIGGIKPSNVNDCMATGAAGVAVLSPIMRAKDPREVARAYRDALDSTI